MKLTRLLPPAIVLLATAAATLPLPVQAYTTAGMCSYNMEDPIYVNITLNDDVLTIGRLGSHPITYAPISDNNIVVDSNNETWVYQSHPTNDRTPAFTLNNTDSIHSISCIGFYNGHPIPNDF